jgi:hypothetical protein
MRVVGERLGIAPGGSTGTGVYGALKVLRLARRRSRLSTTGRAADEAAAHEPRPRHHTRPAGTGDQTVGGIGTVVLMPVEPLIILVAAPARRM